MNTIYVVGLGPGAFDRMTMEAKAVLESCDWIVGYTVYVDLIREHFGEKQFLSTPMRQEVERCRLAFAKAREGHKVAMVCSGDAGVYGMSGLMLEIGEEFPDIDVQVVAGVTAALSGAALLGAPLMHDFALISLSDLLTPWESIEKRLLLASEADFVIVLYNPSSMKRKDYLEKACSLMLRHKSPSTPCGIVRNIGREGERCELLSLAELKEAETDMFSTVFIGNAQTGRIGNKLVTPRGYQI